MKIRLWAGTTMTFKMKVFSNPIHMPTSLLMTALDEECRHLGFAARSFFPDHKTTVVTDFDDDDSEAYFYIEDDEYVALKLAGVLI